MIYIIPIIIVPNSTVYSYLGIIELIVRLKYPGKFVHTELRQWAVPFHA